VLPYRIHVIRFFPYYSILRDAAACVNIRSWAALFLSRRFLGKCVCVKSSNGNHHHTPSDKTNTSEKKSLGLKRKKVTSQKKKKGRHNAKWIYKSSPKTAAHIFHKRIEFYLAISLTHTTVCWGLGALFCYSHFSSCLMKSLSQLFLLCAVVCHTRNTRFFGFQIMFGKNSIVYILMACCVGKCHWLLIYTHLLRLH
jgi:hypothetical protein